ncbi:hypothetical protein L9F63_002515, partial [Diploptera punctata]
RQSSVPFCSHARKLLYPLAPHLGQHRCSSIYEPDYLEVGKSKIPLHNPLNLQIRGYDFPVLENFQRYVHKIAKNMDIEIEDGWAVPPQYLQVQRFKPQSTVIDSEYKMAVYERNIQVVELPSTVGEIFFEVLQTALPEGVTLTVHEHTEEQEENRYIPDNELIELKTKLEELGGPSKKK